MRATFSMQLFIGIFSQFVTGRDVSNMYSNT